MLKRVDVLNFRGLRNVSVDLEPLTVLAGPNSSGKSSFLAALSPDQPKASDFWHHDWSTEVSLHLRGAGYNHAFSWRHPTPNTFVGNWGEKRPYAFQMLRLDVSAMREINQAQPTSQLSSNGGSLASLIGSFKSGQRADLAAEVCSLIPVFRNVDHQLAGHGTISIQFQDRWNDQVWYSPGEVSDGTMLVTAFLALRYQQPLPTLIAIEELE